ncbi:unnamed protein product [Owenia fusiformis]|uniref:Uncharacterized protein n=1 Tax=Owenia fusiformis TaxID=6347 RepID=A0A8J1TBZ1_OWEFU|nr:unnamed protein product [Owenia fusiformis]
MRGRGRGRGGRSGRGRGGSRQGAKVASEDNSDLDINKDLRGFFVGTASFDKHYDAQVSNRNRYIAGITVLQNNGVEISQNARIRALAAAWARQDLNLANRLLKDQENYSFNEVLKAVTLLDSSRQIRVHEKKLKRLQLQAEKVKPRKLGLIKSQIDNLKVIKPKVGSASGAVCKHVRSWVRNFSKDQLEYFALHMPTEPWRKLADICHFNPNQDFPSLPWFLPFCYGSPAPEDTMVSHCKDITEDNLNSMIKEYPVPYSHIKEHKDKLTSESKAKIATYTSKLDTLLWYYEDIACEEVDRIINDRLEAGETVSLPDGKLLERLLKIKMIREDIPTSILWYQVPTKKACNSCDTCNTKAQFYPLLLPIGQKRLDNISLPMEAPIVVIGDMSSSMNVAIRTSTIIASLLTAITSAKLVFFNQDNHEAPFIPTNIEEILKMAVTNQASGSTNPAASLWPFYEAKEKVNTFIIVTDEEENQRCQNMDFATMFEKYSREVYPSTLVFVSFLQNQHSTGYMVPKLNEKGFHPLVFKLDRTKPDLTKLDNLFGLLSSTSQDFDAQISAMEQELNISDVDMSQLHLGSDSAVQNSETAVQDSETVVKDSKTAVQDTETGVQDSDSK